MIFRRGATDRLRPAEVRAEVHDPRRLPDRHDPTPHPPTRKTAPRSSPSTSPPVLRSTTPPPFPPRPSPAARRPHFRTVPVHRRPAPPRGMLRVLQRPNEFSGWRPAAPSSTPAPDRTSSSENAATPRHCREICDNRSNCPAVNVSFSGLHAARSNRLPASAARALWPAAPRPRGLHPPPPPPHGARRLHHIF